MENYFMPTRVVMGEGCILANSHLLKSLGSKAMIVTGRGSARGNGSLADVEAALRQEGVAYFIYDKVMSNPTVACAYEGALAARGEQADFIIAIGGGSPMDAAKAMALLAVQDIDDSCLFQGIYENKVLPIAAVPTTAGTGSEVTQYAILTNDKAQTKTSIATPLLFPRFAFLDPKYMASLSVETTINTAVDALSHAVEGMLSVRATAISDALAIESTKRIMQLVPAMLKAKKSSDPAAFDLQARDDFQKASLMAGMVIAQTGTTAVHAMGYSLTYFKDIDHGRANGLLLPQYLAFVESRDSVIADKIIQAMGLKSVDAFKALMWELLGQKEIISKIEMSLFSELAIKTGNIKNSKVQPTKEDINEMYQLVFNEKES